VSGDIGQCGRESTALHFDYYSTTKKTATPPGPARGPIGARRRPQRACARRRADPHARRFASEKNQRRKNCKRENTDEIYLFSLFEVFDGDDDAGRANDVATSRHVRLVPLLTQNNTSKKIFNRASKGTSAHDSTSKLGPHPPLIRRRRLPHAFVAVRETSA